MARKVLLHACCAPCSIAIIDELRRSGDLTVIFYNPNIQPLAEYEKRKADVVRVFAEWGVPMVDLDRETEAWEAGVAGIAQDKEGGPRCRACYAQRLAKAAALATEHGFDAFATSLSSGRQKDSQEINAIGKAIGLAVGTTFLSVDWKKGGRLEKARAMVNERGIYRQDYCGCLASLAAARARRSERD